MSESVHAFIEWAAGTGCLFYTAMWLIKLSCLIFGRRQRLLARLGREPEKRELQEEVRKMIHAR